MSVRILLLVYIKYNIPQLYSIFLLFIQNLASYSLHVWQCLYYFRCNILKRVPNSALWLLRFPAAGEMRLRACMCCRLIMFFRLWSVISGFIFICSPMGIVLVNTHSSFQVIIILFVLSAGRLSDAAAQGVQPDQIIFTDVAMKNEHIRRSSLADLFLDS